MKKILAAVDFTDSSFHAAKAAARIAADEQAELHLLNVYHIPNPLQTLPIELIVTTEELQKETESRLKQLAVLLASDELPRDRIFLHSRNGHTGKEIIEMSEYLNASLIVMGMREESQIRDILTVNPAESVARKSHRPLLLLPGNSNFKKPKHILFATDGKEDAGSASYSLLTDWCKRYGAELEIVHLQQHREPADKERIMESLEPGFAQIRHSFSFPETEHITESILSIAGDCGADLIVMESNRHSLLGRLLGRDHTENVLHNIELPVLILHR
jgi:nucleotide-binding universal stress UspA family protein